MFDLFSQIISYGDSSLVKFEPTEHERFVSINSRDESKQFSLSLEEDGVELTEYELERQRNIEERKRLLG